MLRFILTAALAAGLATAAWAQSAEPVLRIETGTHTGALNAAATDAAGHVLVTVSDDKTARVWSLPDLRPLGVLRPPIGGGSEGQLDAVAVTPDGHFAAIGGTLSGPDKDAVVLLFDLQTRQVVKRLAGLPSYVDALAISHDGQRLAVGMAGESGVSVWNIADLRPIFSDKYIRSVIGLAFSRNGNLATSSYEGLLRLYDPNGHLLRKVETQAGAKLYRVAFDPDGRELAVGYAGVAAVEIRDGGTLEVVAKPDLSGLQAKDLPNVAWSADGRTLYAAGATFIDGANPMLAWSARGRGPRRIAGPPFRVNGTDPVPLPGGGVVALAFDGEMAVLAANGRTIAERHPNRADAVPSLNLEDPTRRFLLSSDGRRVAWTMYDSKERWNVADASGFAVTTPDAPPADLTDWTASAGGLTVTDWDGNMDPKLNGQLFKLGIFETAMSVAVLPGHVLVGGDRSLHLYSGAYREVWARESPGVTWHVNQSPDGRLAVGSFSDGTVRWFRMRDGQELLAVFMTKDAQRWVAFTPSGYYTASPGGEDLIGWHLNRGPDQAADFFPVSQFRDRFYRPDVVTRVLTTLDEKEALRQADAARGLAARPPAPIAEDLPPVVTILSPADGTTITGDEASIGYSVRSPSGKPVRTVRVLIDGRPLPNMRGLGRTDAAPAKNDAGNRITVPLPSEPSIEVALLAETETRVSEPARVRLNRAAKPAAVHKPALYALVIGVGDYADPKLHLDYAGKDARDFADMLRKHGAGLYREVQVKLLADRDASRDAVLDGLDWLRKQTTAEDVAVLFMAGHGTDDQSGRFYFLPANVDVQRLRSTAVAGGEVKDALADTPGRVVAFLDTCHSGSVLGGNFRGLPSVDHLSNELSSAESGMIVFASSTGRELSAEMPNLRNGVFTAALLEAMSGKADADKKGAVTIEDLNYYVLNRVKVLTNGEQHPNMLRPQSIRDFPLLTDAG